MEERLGRRMPPSYREFLRVSDGWRHAGGFVWLLAGTADARWHDNESGLADLFEEYLDEDAEPEERREADLWRRGLQLDVESDITHVLMDPEDVDEDGEWAVYTWASWLAAPPERHANFLEFMCDSTGSSTACGRTGAATGSRSSPTARRASWTPVWRKPGRRRWAAAGNGPWKCWMRPSGTADREPPVWATRYAACSGRPTWCTSRTW
ncbi:hypothetical protein SGLAM104S_09043 [Streptomyces glaucescens]